MIFDLNISAPKLVEILNFDKFSMVLGENSQNQSKDMKDLGEMRLSQVLQEAFTNLSEKLDG